VRRKARSRTLIVYWRQGGGGQRDCSQGGKLKDKPGEPQKKQWKRGENSSKGTVAITVQGREETDKGKGSPCEGTTESLDRLGEVHNKSKKFQGKRLVIGGKKKFSSKRLGMQFLSRG